MTTKDNVLQDLIAVGVKREEAEKHFLSACQHYISNWGKYTSQDIEDCLSEGYAESKSGVSVMYIDTDGITSDRKILEQLNEKFNIELKDDGEVRVKKVIDSGELELKEGMPFSEIIEQCGENLDSVCAYEIQGQVLFLGSDNRWYTITTESSISVAHTDFVKECVEDAMDGPDLTEDQVNELRELVKKYNGVG